MNLFNEKGAAIVEFALIVPLLLMLLFGIIEFGMMVYNQQVITNASREAARYGIVAPPRHSPTEIETVATEHCGRLVTFGTTNTPVCITEPKNKAGNVIDTSVAEFGDELKVQVSYDYSFLLMPAFMSELIGGITLTAQTVMTYE